MKSRSANKPQGEGPGQAAAQPEQSQAEGSAEERSLEMLSGKAPPKNQAVIIN